MGLHKNFNKCLSDRDKSYLDLLHDDFIVRSHKSGNSFIKKNGHLW